MFVVGFVFALLCPLLAMIALAIALALGEAGVASLTAALLGYGVATDWHIWRRQARAAIPLPADQASLWRLPSWLPARGTIDIAISGGLQWSLPSRAKSLSSPSAPALRGAISFQARATTGYQTGQHRLSEGSARTALPPGRHESGPASRIAVLTTDAAYLRLLDRVLSEAGYSVISCQDSDTAVHLANREQPDLVILDLDIMGYRSGWSVLDLLALGPATTHIPIIVTTMYLESVRAAEEWLGDHHILTLPKPFAPADLTVAVSAALGLSEDRTLPSHWSTSHRWGI